MPDMWRLCDIALVRLKADVGLESAIPSKVFEAMAMGKPILLVAPEGDASQLVLRSGCGLWVQPGDSEGFSRAVRKLTTVSYRNDLGDAGLRASERHTRRAQASAILRVLAEARTGSSS
jgi:glycosyltransferase involved in cell wall biosynthesis